MTAPRAAQDTTRDTEERVALCSQPWQRSVVMHWVTADGMACTKKPGIWLLEHGSAAAITCRLCARAFARQQQQQAPAATMGRGEQG